MTPDTKTYKVRFGNEQVLIVAEEDLSAAAAQNGGILTIEKSEVSLFKPVGQSINTIIIREPLPYPIQYPTPLNPYITYSGSAGGQTIPKSPSTASFGGGTIGGFNNCTANN